MESYNYNSPNVGTLPSMGATVTPQDQPPVPTYEVASQYQQQFIQPNFPQNPPPAFSAPPPVYYPQPGAYPIQTQGFAVPPGQMGIQQGPMDMTQQMNRKARDHQRMMKTRMVISVVSSLVFIAFIILYSFGIF